MSRVKKIENDAILLSKDFETAQKIVEKLKNDYGWGASSKIIFYNNTSDKLTLTDSEHFYGRWENKAPSEVSEILCIFHKSFLL